MKYTAAGARISGDGIYRYSLWRDWRHSCADITNLHMKTCLFIMLNPSTADADADDPTIRRCVAFAKGFGYDGLEVVNLFAYRATKPSELFEYPKTGGDPVGWENQKYITQAATTARMIICAWGAHGGFIGQDETVKGWLEDTGKPLYALGLTKEGHPRHPLYLPSNTQLVRMDQVSAS